jgi:hypothetical protein
MTAVALAATMHAGAREPIHHHGHGAHEHGLAHVDIVAEQRTVRIEIETPVMNLVGFEHLPRDDREHAALRDAVVALKDTNRLVGLSSDARCTLQDLHMISPLLDEEDREAHEQGHADHNLHIDMFIAWQFECAAPGALRAIEFSGLFARFPGMQRLRVQAVTPAFQTSAMLTPDTSLLRW